MSLDFSSLLELLLSAVGGGGLVACFTIPEKKKAVKLENNAKIIDDCYKHIGVLEGELKKMRDYYESLLSQRDEEIRQRDEEIKQLRDRQDELESQIAMFRNNRDAKGRFKKRSCQPE